MFNLQTIIVLSWLGCGVLSVIIFELLKWYDDKMWDKLYPEHKNNANPPVFQWYLQELIAFIFGAISLIIAIRDVLKYKKPSIKK